MNGNTELKTITVSPNIQPINRGKKRLINNTRVPPTIPANAVVEWDANARVIESKRPAVPNIHFLFAKNHPDVRIDNPPTV